MRRVRFLPTAVISILKIRETVGQFRAFKECEEIVGASEDVLDSQSSLESIVVYLLDIFRTLCASIVT